MCTVSMIADYYDKRTWPGSPPFPYNPPAPLPPVPQWDEESKRLLREVLERLDKLDKRLGDIECNDIAKEKLFKQLGL